MADEWKTVAKAAFGIFKDSLTGYVENQAVDDFAKERIDQYAQEWWGAQNASTPEVKAEHEDNLKHLVAQARGEARRLQIGISTEAKDTVGRLLEMAGSLFIKVVPSIIAAL
jgi:DNA phosphorothioation-dependent restriction protein DptG